MGRMPIKQKTQERAVFCHSKKQRKPLIIPLGIWEMLFIIENGPRGNAGNVWKGEE